MTRKKTTHNGKSEKLHGEGGTVEMADNVANLVASGIQTVNELADIFGKVSSSVDRRRTVRTDNDVKMLKAETDARKETDRHIEQMTKLDQERSKVDDLAANKEANRSVLMETIKVLKEQHEYYLKLSKDEFLSDRVSSRLDKLNDIISALAMELIKGL